jgi:hypothetical protein
MAVAKKACSRTTGGAHSDPLAITCVSPKVVGTSSLVYATGHFRSTASYASSTSALPRSLVNTGSVRLIRFIRSPSANRRRPL